MPNKVYDIVKWLSILLLPAMATLVGTLSTIWGWPHGEQVMLSINAIALFLGAAIGLSTRQYNNSKEDKQDAV